MSKIIGVTVTTPLKKSGGGGGLTADQSALLDNLKNWYDKEHYTGEMTGTFTATNGGGTFEIGSTIKSTFTWKFSKLPTKLTVGGKAVNPPTQEGTTDEQTFRGTSQTSSSFAISGEYSGPYGPEPASKTWTYSFQNKRYWGMAEVPDPIDPTTIDSTFIKSLSNNEFSTSRAKNISLKDGASNKRICYAYPKRLGEASFTMGGFAGGFDDPLEVSFENGATPPYAEPYYVYFSTNPGVGNLDVVVK